MQHQKDALDAIIRIGELISMSAQPEDALRAAALEIERVLDVDVVTFYLREGDAFRSVVESHPAAVIEVAQMLDYHRRVFDALETLVINDREAPEIDAPMRDRLRGLGFSAFMAAPLVAQGVAFGALSVDHREPRVWTADEVNLVNTFAHQIASAMQDARLLRELQAKVDELQVIGRVGQMLAMSASPEAALPEAARELARQLRADVVSFHLREGSVLRLVTESRPVSPSEIETIENYHRRILDRLETVLVFDRDSPDVDAVQRERLRDFKLAAFIGVPLIAKKEALGILFVNQNTPRPWTSEEVRLTETVARQIASALENANLLRETQARVRELEGVARMSTLAASPVDEKALAQRALQVVSELLKIDVGSVYLLQGNELQLLATWNANLVPSTPVEVTPRVRELFQSRQPLILDRQHPTELRGQAQARFAQQNARALLVMPMVAGREHLGLLCVAKRDEHTWSENEVRSLETIANELAIGVSNTRLYREQADRAHRLSLLAQLSRACSSTLQKDELLKTAVDKIREMVSGSQVSIRLVEGDHLTEGVGAGYHYPERRAPRIRIDQLLSTILHGKKPLAVADLEHAPQVPKFYRERRHAEGARALLALPLIAEDEALGILSIFRPEPHEWTVAEIEFAETIANTVAVSVANANHFELLQQERRNLEATLNSVFSGVFTTDRDGVIQSFNRAASQMTGYSEAEVRGKNWVYEISRVGQSGRPDLLIFEAMEEDDVIFGLAPRTLTTADGREIPLAEAAAPLRDQDGNVRGAVGAFWDRTKERQSEIAKRDFLTELSHEFRNTVTGLLSMADLLRQKNVRGRTRADATAVLMEQVEQLKSFADAFSRFESEKFNSPLEEETLSLMPLVGKLLKEMKLRYPERTFELHGRAGRVWADSARLRTVLQNLLQNAVKYSPPGSPVGIRVKAVDQEFVLIAIHNQGPAIPSDEQERIFSRGFRARSNGSDGAIEGSGIGLWLVQAKLREMDGEIWVESNDEQGTTFSFTLRQARVESAKAQAARPDRGRRAARDRAPAHSARARRVSDPYRPQRTRGAAARGRRATRPRHPRRGPA